MKCKWLLILLAIMLLMPNMMASKDDKSVALESKWAHIASDKLIDKGNSYFNLDKPDSALVCYTIVANRRFATNKHDTLELKQSAKALNNIGNIYHAYYYDFLKAQECFQMALDIASTYHFDDVLPIIYSNIGLLEMLNYVMHPESESIADSIITIYQQALEKSFACTDQRYIENIGNIATNLAANAMALDKMEKAENLLNKYLQLQSHDTTRHEIMSKSFCQAVLECSHKNYPQALMHIDNAIAHVASVKDLGKIVLFKAHILNRAGQKSQAIELLKESIETSRKNNRQLSLLDAYKSIADFYHQAGDFAAAEKYELLYLRQKDVVLNKSKVISMSEQRFLMQIDQANKHAEQIAYESRIKQRILWIVIAFASILAISLLMLLHKYRQVKERNQRLYLSNVELLAADEENRAMMKALDESGIQTREKVKYRNNAAMDSEAKSALLHRIFIVMETDNSIFKDDFTIDDLAERVDSSRNLVSQVINELRHCNFSAFINEYRIKEACRRMNDVEHYGNQTIEAIAGSVGFKSRSSFSKVFKKHTGLTPSAYQQLAKSNLRQSS